MISFRVEYLTALGELHVFEDVSGEDASIIVSNALMHAENHKLKAWEIKLKVITAHRYSIKYTFPIMTPNTAISIQLFDN